MYSELVEAKLVEVSLPFIRWNIYETWNTLDNKAFQSMMPVTKGFLMLMNGSVSVDVS